MDKYENIKTFSELIELEHGKIGFKSRNEYEEKAQSFIVSEMLKVARKEAKLTQQQLAEKSNTDKRYIAQLENGKTDINLSILIRIFEQGLNRHKVLDNVAELPEGRVMTAVLRKIFRH